MVSYAPTTELDSDTSSSVTTSNPTSQCSESTESTKSMETTDSTKTAVDDNETGIKNTFDNVLKTTLGYHPMNEKGFQEACRELRVQSKAPSWKEFQAQCDDQFMPKLKTLLENDNFTRAGFLEASCGELNHASTEQKLDAWETFQTWSDKKFAPVRETMSREKFSNDESGFTEACCLAGVTGDYLTFKRYCEFISTGEEEFMSNGGVWLSDPHIRLIIDNAQKRTPGAWTNMFEIFGTSVKLEIGHDDEFKYRISLMENEDEDDGVPLSDDDSYARELLDANDRTEKRSNKWLAKDVLKGVHAYLEPEPEIPLTLERNWFALHRDASPHFFGFQIGSLERCPRVNKTNDRYSAPTTIPSGANNPTNGAAEAANSDEWFNTWIPVALKVDQETYRSTGVYLINPRRIRHKIRGSVSDTFKGSLKDAFCVCIASKIAETSEQHTIDWDHIPSETYNEGKGKLKVAPCCLNINTGPPTIMIS